MNDLPTLFIYENIIPIFYLLYAIFIFSLIFSIDRLVYFVVWHKNVLEGKKNKHPYPYAFFFKKINPTCPTPPTLLRTPLESQTVRSFFMLILLILALKKYVLPFLGLL